MYSCIENVAIISIFILVISTYYVAYTVKTNICSLVFIPKRIKYFICCSQPMNYLYEQTMSPLRKGTGQQLLIQIIYAILPLSSVIYLRPFILFLFVYRFQQLAVILENFAATLTCIFFIFQPHFITTINVIFIALLPPS